MLRSFSSAFSRVRAGAFAARNVTRSSCRKVSTEGPSQTYRAKREPLVTPFMVLVGIIPFFTFALGTWQVKRLKWKVALIDDLEEKLEREPMPLPPQVNLAALPDFAFRKVMLKGRWDNAHAILLGPRVRDGTIGYHLIVPLVRSDGSTVLVDRGFVTKELAQTARRVQDKEQTEVEILGMLRTAQVRNAFTPDNHPEKGEWYWADVDAMAAFAGGEAAGVQPVFIEEVFGRQSGSIPATYGPGLIRASWLKGTSPLNRTHSFILSTHFFSRTLLAPTLESLVSPPFTFDSLIESLSHAPCPLTLMLSEVSYTTMRSTSSTLASNVVTTRSATTSKRERGADRCLPVHRSPCAAKMATAPDCVVGPQETRTISGPEEVFDTENVAEALRVKQRMRARQALRSIITNPSVYANRERLDSASASSSSSSSSPGSTPPSTPPILPTDLTFPTGNRYEGLTRPLGINVFRRRSELSFKTPLSDDLEGQASSIQVSLFRHQQESVTTLL
ncbi:hypothetical protein ONZ51_g11458 [Trametes cubensis]|uniref:SURF1-like protein n=1 Tax=Trametes cubensis TaxID=1111947 RepID=A0AAD7X6B3_9APHY|nr:hypothetical protein ONZ51_g11458 [Trametes cubensis]